MSEIRRRFLAAGALLVPGSALAQSAQVQNPSAFGLNVRDFGAAGNGTADDTAAVQSAIDKGRANGAVVHFPSGTYRTTSTLTIGSAVMLRGSGALSTIISGTGLRSGQSVLHIDGTINPNLDGIEVCGLRFTSNNNASDLIRINRASNSVFRDIFLGGGRHGIVITGNRTYSLQFDRCIHYGGALNRTVHFDAYAGGGHIAFTGCNFSGTIGVGGDARSAVTGIGFNSCNFEGTGQQAFYWNGDIQGLQFANCRFEKNGTTDIVIDPAAGKGAFGISIAGCWFETDQRPPSPIQFGGTGGAVRGFAVTGNYAQDYSRALVNLNGEGGSGIISGNYLNSPMAAVNAVRSGVLVVNNEAANGVLSPTWNPPLSTADYTVTNPTANRSLDVSGAGAGDVRQVLGTLISDLIAAGILK